MPFGPFGKAGFCYIRNTSNGERSEKSAHSSVSPLGTPLRGVALNGERRVSPLGDVSEEEGGEVKKLSKKLCLDFIRTGRCKQGSKCVFVHEENYSGAYKTRVDYLEQLVRQKYGEMRG
jgi:hypothetical protein